MNWKCSTVVAKEVIKRIKPLCIGISSYQHRSHAYATRYTLYKSTKTFSTFIFDRSAGRQTFCYCVFHRYLFRGKKGTGNKTNFVTSLRRYNFYFGQRTFECYSPYIFPYKNYTWNRATFLFILKPLLRDNAIKIVVRFPQCEYCVGNQAIADLPNSSNNKIRYHLVANRRSSNGRWSLNFSLKNDSGRSVTRGTRDIWAQKNLLPFLGVRPHCYVSFYDLLDEQKHFATEQQITFDYTRGCCPLAQ